MTNCCKITNRHLKCRRKDGKIFSLPRKFSKKKCIQKKIKGFSKKSSCAPFKFCKKGGAIHKNMLDTELKQCSLNPVTGWRRNGKCVKYNDDFGVHTVCAIMDNNFLNYTKSKGNDLSSVVSKGDKWCLCEKRWEEAYAAGLAPKVILESTSKNVEENIKKKINKFTAKKGGKRRKQFLYHPNNPDKSFDVYIDKNPKDTIPIKYTTVEDVRNTIIKLEKLYKNNKYTHKRIWQVGMILKVRLEAMKKHKKKLYPNAKYVLQRFNLANKYFKFLSNRTKLSEKDRRSLVFR